MILKTAVTTTRQYKMKFWKWTFLQQDSREFHKNPRGIYQLLQNQKYELNIRVIHKNSYFNKTALR